jgi:hypothetical protein
VTGGSDTAITLVLLLTFAALVTVHVATVFSLAQKRHVTAAMVGLFVPPLAPFWAIRKGMKARGAAWIVLALLYATALAFAS